VVGGHIHAAVMGDQDALLSLGSIQMSWVSPPHWTSRKLLPPSVEKPELESATITSVGLEVETARRI